MSKSLIDHTSTQKFNQNRHLFQPQNSGTQIDSINIGLASPIRIRKWAERILPNGKKVGEVVNSKTVNYKTLKPEVGGLFCEKIFGPIEDFECLCAPTKRKSKTQNKFCPDCDVEFTVSRIRRYRLGYIKLASPVSHIWYLRGRPRFLNILFDRGIALKTGKKKGKIKDFKPIIYGIDGIYVPILRLIKTNKKPNVTAREGGLSLGLAFNRQKKNTVVIAANLDTKESEFRQSSEAASLENRNFSCRFAKFYVTFLDDVTENKVFGKGSNKLQNYFTGLTDNTTPLWKIVPTPTKQGSILCEPEFYAKHKTQINRLLVDDFCNPTALVDGCTLWRRPMLRIKQKVDLHKKKKGLLLLRGCLLDFKKYQRSFLERWRTDAKSKKSEQGGQRSLVFSKSNLVPWKTGSHKPTTTKLIPRFPHYFVSQSKLPRLSELPSLRRGSCLHPFGRKNRKTDLNQLSLESSLGGSHFVKKTSESFNPLAYPEGVNNGPEGGCFAREVVPTPNQVSLQKLQTLNLLNFPYYTTDSLFPPLKGCTDLMQSKKQNTDEPILQKLPTKRYPSLFTYNFLEKSGLLWHDFGNYNISPNIYTSLQFFFKSRYFTRKLRNIFFVDQSSQDPLRSIDLGFIPSIKPRVRFHRIPKKTKFFSPWEGRPDLKRELAVSANLLGQKNPKNFHYCLAGNLLFKKKLTKIVCNSGHCRYTIHSQKTLKKNVNLDSTSPFKASEAALWLPNKVRVRRELASLPFRKFLSRLDNTTPPLSEQNKHIVIDNKKQGSVGAPPKEVKINDFMCKNKLFLNRTVVKAESLIFFTEKKSSLLPMGQYRNQPFSGFPLLKSKFFHSQKNLLDKNEFVRPTISVLESSRSISHIKKTHLSSTPLFDQSPLVHHELKNTSLKFTQSIKARSTDPGEVVSTLGKQVRSFVEPFFRISPPPYDNTRGPGFMTLTSNIKSILRAKVTYNKSVVMSNNAMPGKEYKLYDRYKIKSLAKQVHSVCEPFSPLRATREPVEFIPRSFYALPGKTQIFFRNIKNRDDFLTTAQSKKNLLNFSRAKQWASQATPLAKQPGPFEGCSLPCSSEVNLSKLRTFVPDKGLPHAAFTAASNFSSNNSGNASRFSKQKKTRTNLQSQIDPYYPLSSRCVFKFIKGDENKTLEFKSLWGHFVKYMTSNFVKQDAIIHPYSNRLGNRFIVQNGVEYKYIKVVLTGSEAICYWLKNLNLHVLESILKKKIKNLDDKIKRYRSRASLYKFQQKTLKNIIQYRRKVYRIVKLVYYLKKNKLRPDWLMISILPVLPPNLRPIIQLQSNQTAVSDLNQLYKRVLYRNLRIEKYLNRSRETDSHEIRFHQRLLQEAVDSLLDNGKGGSPLACSPNGRPFKSLAEILKGKKGRFRQNLLGKRVDYSGRSVIVVGPELKLHECGLPKEMAIELFQPFIIRDLINLSQQANDDKITIITAKHLIKTEHSIVWQILQKILKNHPILLNRAPTLHRLGIQAFQPKLVQGRAILLHPLVCPAFNADFDGDQMAVHVPLCFQSRAEAWKLMWSRNNLLSPATGEPIVVPSQDMVLGCYYLTTINNNGVRRFFNTPKLSSLTKTGGADLSWTGNARRTYKPTKFNSNSVDIISETQKILTSRSGLSLQNKNVNQKQFKQDISQTGDVNVIRLGKYFYSLDDVLVAFSQNKVFLHSLIWVKWENNVELENFNEKPIEVRVDYYGNIQKIYSKYFQYVDNQNTRISQFILTTVGRIILNKTLP